MNVTDQATFLRNNGVNQDMSYPRYQNGLFQNGLFQNDLRQLHQDVGLHQDVVLHPAPFHLDDDDGYSADDDGYFADDDFTKPPVLLGRGFKVLGKLAKGAARIKSFAKKAKMAGRAGKSLKNAAKTPGNLLVRTYKYAKWLVSRPPVSTYSKFAAAMERGQSAVTVLDAFSVVMPFLKGSKKNRKVLKGVAGEGAQRLAKRARRNTIISNVSIKKNLKHNAGKMEADGDLAEDLTKSKTTRKINRQKRKKSEKDVKTACPWKPKKKSTRLNIKSKKKKPTRLNVMTRHNCGNDDDSDDDDDDDNFKIPTHSPSQASPTENPLYQESSGPFNLSQGLSEGGMGKRQAEAILKKDTLKNRLKQVFVPDSDYFLNPSSALFPWHYARGRKLLTYGTRMGILDPSFMIKSILSTVNLVENAVFRPLVYVYQFLKGKGKKGINYRYDDLYTRALNRCNGKKGCQKNYAELFGRRSDKILSPQEEALQKLGLVKVKTPPRAVKNNFVLKLYNEVKDSAYYKTLRNNPIIKATVFGTAMCAAYEPLGYQSYDECMNVEVVGKMDLWFTDPDVAVAKWTGVKIAEDIVLRAKYGYNSMSAFTPLGIATFISSVLGKKDEFLAWGFSRNNMKEHCKLQEFRIKRWKKDYSNEERKTLLWKLHPQCSPICPHGVRYVDKYGVHYPGEERCSGCNEGWYLSKSEKYKNTCQNSNWCNNGTVIKNPTENKVERCESCDDGYTLNTNTKKCDKIATRLLQEKPSQNAFNGYIYQCVDASDSRKGMPTKHGAERAQHYSFWEIEKYLSGDISGNKNKYFYGYKKEEMCDDQLMLLRWLGDKTFREAHNDIYPSYVNDVAKKYDWGIHSYMNDQFRVLEQVKYGERGTCVANGDTVPDKHPELSSKDKTCTEGCKDGEGDGHCQWKGSEYKCTLKSKDSKGKNNTKTFPYDTCEGSKFEGKSLNTAQTCYEACHGKCVPVEEAPVVTCRSWSRHPGYYAGCSADLDPKDLECDAARTTNFNKVVDALFHRTPGKAFSRESIDKGSGARGNFYDVDGKCGLGFAYKNDPDVPWCGIMGPGWKPEDTSHLSSKNKVGSFSDLHAYMKHGCPGNDWVSQPCFKQMTVHRRAELTPFNLSCNTESSEEACKNTAKNFDVDMVVKGEEPSMCVIDEANRVVQFTDKVGETDHVMCFGSNGPMTVLSGHACTSEIDKTTTAKIDTFGGCRAHCQDSETCKFFGFNRGTSTCTAHASCKSTKVASGTKVYKKERALMYLKQPRYHVGNGHFNRCGVDVFKDELELPGCKTCKEDCNGDQSCVDKCKIENCVMECGIGCLNNNTGGADAFFNFEVDASGNKCACDNLKDSCNLSSTECINGKCTTECNIEKDNKQDVLSCKAATSSDANWQRYQMFRSKTFYFHTKNKPKDARYVVGTDGIREVITPPENIGGMSVMANEPGIKMLTPSNRAPLGWQTKVHWQAPYYHKPGTRTRDKEKEYGPFPERKITIHTDGKKTGLILSAGDYACELPDEEADDGEIKRKVAKNCAMKYQDEVESNLDFNTKWKQMRKVNDRRPVLGQAEPWRQLTCNPGEHIDELNFKEFVVRRDCSPADDCYDGVNLHDNYDVAHNDRTDINMSKKRDFKRNERMLWAFGSYDTENQGSTAKYHRLQIRSNEGMTAETSSEKRQGGNWPPTRWKAEPPTSYKGWVWCNREAEGGWDMGGVPLEYFRYCQGGHGGGNRKEDVFGQELGGKATFDLPAEIVGKNAFVQDYRRSLGKDEAEKEKYSMINALVLKNDEAGISGINLMCSNTKHTNTFSSHEKGNTMLLDETSAMSLCESKGRKLCHPTQINGTSTDIVKGWTTAGVVESNLMDYRVEENRSECSIRPISKEECMKFAEAQGVTMKEMSSTDGKVDFSTGNVPLPKGCSVLQHIKPEARGKIEVPIYEEDGMTATGATAEVDDTRKKQALAVFWNKDNTSSARGDLVCPSVTVARKYEDSQKTGAKAAFCCDTSLPAQSTYSHVGFDTQPGVNKHLHYENMCVTEDGTSAVFRCDPETGFILNHDNDNKREFGKDKHYRCNEYYKLYEQTSGLFTKAYYAPNRTCRPVAIDKIRSGNDYMDKTNPEGRFMSDVWSSASEVFFGNAGNNSSNKDYTVSCKRRGGVCGIAVKAMQIETTHGMGKDKGTWGPDSNKNHWGGNVQYWFESIKRHQYERIQDHHEVSNNQVPKRSSIQNPQFGHHRQDMQGITNVEVMCCDGHTEIAVHGDNGPNESVLRHAVYDLNYKELAHVAGGVAVRGQIEKACDTLGGKFTWNGTNSTCKGIPNDNPQGSWEQVNTLDLEGGKLLQEGGPCCVNGSFSGAFKDQWSKKEMEESEFLQLTMKILNNIEEPVYQAHSMLKCGIGSVAGTAGAIAKAQIPPQCCFPYVKDGKTYFPMPSPVPVLKFNEVEKLSKCATNFAKNMGRDWSALGDSSLRAMGFHDAFKGVRLWREDLVPYRKDPTMLWAAAWTAIKKAAKAVTNSVSKAWTNFTNSAVGNFIVSSVEKAGTLAKKVADAAWKEVTNNKVFKQVTKLAGRAIGTIKRGADIVGNWIGDTYVRALVEPPFACCKGYTCDDPNTPSAMKKALSARACAKAGGDWCLDGYDRVGSQAVYCNKFVRLLGSVVDVGVGFVEDTAGLGMCTTTALMPEIKCATLNFSGGMDQRIRYRRTARHAKKAENHINPIPGRWTPIYGCVDKNGKPQPLNNVIVGSNSQQKASTNSFYESGIAKLEPMWTSVGHGDHMGITAVGFTCPPGTTYKRIGPKDANPALKEEARAWDSTHHPGHQDNAMFLPEYREAGMFNFALTAGTPNLYDMCGKNVDNWGTNCPHYFEGWRRRSYNINKLDGDASTGGAWSKIDLGVWSRDLHQYDKCHTGRKGISEDDVKNGKTADSQGTKRQACYSWHDCGLRNNKDDCEGKPGPCEWADDKCMLRNFADFEV